jgi:hypothetical protein
VGRASITLTGPRVGTSRTAPKRHRSRSATYVLGKRVPAVRDGLEEAAAHHFAARVDSCRGQERGRAAHDMGLVEQHAAPVRVGNENDGEKGASAAADVDHDAEATEVVGSEHGPC